MTVHNGWTIDVVISDGLVADMCLLDSLARLQLVAKRLGGNVRLLAAPVGLRELIDFAGLSEVLPAD